MITRGQVFVLSGDTPIISKAIKIITNSDWSHVGWVVDEDHILEAEWNGVIISPLSKYKDFFDEKFKTFSLPLKNDLVEKALNKALTYVGKAGYDYQLAASLGWALLTRKKCHSHLREWGGAFICAELVAKPLWEETGFRFISEKYDIDFTVPCDIFNKLNQSKLSEEVKIASPDSLIQSMNVGAEDLLIKKLELPKLELPDPSKQNPT